MMEMLVCVRSQLLLPHVKRSKYLSSLLGLQVVVDPGNVAEKRVGRALFRQSKIQKSHITPTKVNQQHTHHPPFMNQNASGTE
jgi:hypothetical protein